MAEKRDKRYTPASDRLIRALYEDGDCRMARYPDDVEVELADGRKVKLDELAEKLDRRLGPSTGAD